MHSEKNSIKVSFAAAFVCASTLGLQAEGPGPYFRLEAGPSIEQDVRVQSMQGVATPGAKLSLDPGARFDLVGGYGFYDWFAVEAEAGMIYNSFDKFTGPLGSSTVQNLNLWQVPFLVNFVFSLPLHSPFKPYIGVGGGELWTLLDTPGVQNHDDFAFAYQGQAGVSYLINDQMDVGLGYKFLGSFQHDWHEFKTKETYSHSLLFQFTFKY